MGQIRFGQLRLTPKWREVIGLIAGGANAAEIAAAAFDAAHAGFLQAVSDPTLAQSFGLLSQIPYAARSPNFAESLRQLGINVSAQPSFFDLLGAFSDSIDGYVKRRAERTDLGEMAQLAAVESLAARGSSKLGSVFASTPEQIATAFKSETVEQYGAMASDFFARFTQRYLTYYLSRELSNHVGGKRRFFNFVEHTEFLKALEVQCRLACRPIAELAQTWVSATEIERGITFERTTQFLHLALEKIQEVTLLAGAR